MKTRRQQNEAEALSAFIATKAKIDEMLSRLQALSDEHFNTHPEEASWGDVGTPQHHAARLHEITDSAFHEGEHAE
ncbi:hypothetical protein CLV78_11929 [Aliiruegeria haliotis]|uniref:Uncharacterized protein n=1 Tax=Aliiruegeria haliotis TaxID=1280846 RepID=A0A2T0REW4_9RHOB|nr:hypothetical protein [Aliiruegeria haliotis]PRY19697.1 hypothetical protein CLV78_11929 [Aliiruegeria haliotis]